MVANPRIDRLPPIGTDDDCDCVPTLPEETTPAPTAEPPLCEEFGGESLAPVDDTGLLEADDYYTGDWREDFGDSVGISSWRTL